MGDGDDIEGLTNVYESRAIVYYHNIMVSLWQGAKTKDGFLTKYSEGGLCASWGAQYVAKCCPIHICHDCCCHNCCPIHIWGFFKMLFDQSLFSLGPWFELLPQWSGARALFVTDSDFTPWFRFRCYCEVEQFIMSSGGNICLVFIAISDWSSCAPSVKYHSCGRENGSTRMLLSESFIKGSPNCCNLGNVNTLRWFLGMKKW